MDNFDERIKKSKKNVVTSDRINPNTIYQNANKNSRTTTVFNKKLIFRYGLGLVIVILLILNIVFILSGNKDNYESNGEPTAPLDPTAPVDPSTPVDMNELKTFSSVEELRLFLSSSTNGSYDDEMTPPAAPDTPEEGEPGVDSPGTDTDREYETNTRVENVDEPDIVKVNGDYIYYITDRHSRRIYNSGNSEYDTYSLGNQSLYILKNNDKLTVEKKIEFNSEKTLIAENIEAKVYNNKTLDPVDMLFSEQYLIVRVRCSSYDTVEYGTRTYTLNYETINEFYFYDVETFERVKTFSLPGNIVAQRLVDNKLYVISNYAEYSSYDVPCYTEDSLEVSVGLDSIYYCPSFGYNFSSYVMIFCIELGNNIVINETCLLSPYVNGLYATEDTLYLYRKYSYITEKDNEKTVQWPITKIMSINLKGGVSFEGVVEVKGDVSNDFWIDEYNGYLRVASTGYKSISKLIGGKYPYGGYSEEFNRITIFEKDEQGKWIEISSFSEGLGEENETMKSARFNGNIVTIVTFYQTDPLYYVDLTDPYNPVITSELKISGFTVYQHPYKDNYVIGIGYESSESGATIGYKVALFDISDKNNIVQVGEAVTFLYNDGYYNLGVMNNHHELFLDLSNNIFGFRIQEYVDGSYYNSDRKNYFVLFEIDLEDDNPLKILEKIEKVNSSQKILTQTIDRMVFIKDKYFLLATEEVLVYQLTDDGVEFIESVPLV